MHKYMRPLCYVEKYLWQQVFSEHFKSFSTCKKNEFTVHVCTIYMHVHRTKTSTFIKLCHSDRWKHLVSFFFKMVSRSPGNVLRGKQKETGAKQSRPRETGVLLQLRCHADDWQPSAVDTQLPRWLFRSSVPTPSKAHN